MTLRLVDRFGGDTEVSGGSVVLGRLMVSSATRSDTFMNTFPVRTGTFLVPDSGARWHLFSPPTRAEGTFTRAQLLETLDASSIRSVGHSMRHLFERGGTWLDVFDVSPLVPGMSDRVELQQLEVRIKEDVGYLEEVCRRPRTHLRVEVERMPVSRARRFPPQAANYLAAHTEDWERPTLRSVIPKRILASVREDQFDIYENRVAARLVDNLIAYLLRRVREVSRLLQSLKDAKGDKGGSHWRQDRIYKLWDRSLDADAAKRKAEATLSALSHLLHRVSGLRDSQLYRHVPRRGTVSRSLKMTNILSDDANYRYVAELWLALAPHLVQQVRPGRFFEEMQDLCRSFVDFSMLLTLRSLAQLGFEPTQVDVALSAQGVELHRGSRTIRVSLYPQEGIISLNGAGVESLRIVPLCSSLAMLDESVLGPLLAEADARAPVGTTTLILFPSPSDSSAFERLPGELQRRLRSLSHEVTSPGSKRVGFLPVSPWDIGSVERIARQIRWSTMAPQFLRYPPVVARPRLDVLEGPYPWFAVVGDSICIQRAPLPHESLDVGHLVKEAAADLARLESERTDVAEQGREAVRAKEKTERINARKKELNAQIVAAEAKVSQLQIFERDLSEALIVVSELLDCPTCKTQADPRRDFRAGEQRRFTCACRGCSTSWGNVACGHCGAWIPTIQIGGSAWHAYAGPSGWVDQTFGSDVLAAPCLSEAKMAFICPSCGESSG